MKVKSMGRIAFLVLVLVMSMSIMLITAGAEDDVPVEKSISITVTTEPSCGVIKLDWDAVEDAVKYEIYCDSTHIGTLEDKFIAKTDYKVPSTPVNGQFAEHEYMVVATTSTEIITGAVTAAAEHYYEIYSSVSGQDKHTISCECGAVIEAPCSVGENGQEATCYSYAVCGDCGGEFGEKLAHVYETELSADGTYHFYECENHEMCGAVSAKAEHTYSYTQANGTDTHIGKCTVCQYALDAEACSASRSENQATCYSLAKCETCNSEFGQLSDVHVWDTAISTDSTHHFYKCKFYDKCGAINEDSNQTHAYTYAQNSGENTHTGTCSCGYTTAKNNCAVGTSGANATCYSLAVCEVCDSEFGTLLDHVYDTSLSNDQTHHFYKCANYEHCGAIDQSSKAVHIYTYTKNQDSDTHTGACACGYFVIDDCTASGGTDATCYSLAVCGVCNSEFGVKAPHEYDTVLSSDENGHYYTCKNHDKCDGINEQAPHSYAYHQIDGKDSHIGVCTVCSYSTPENECLVGTSGTAATCTSKAVCGICHANFGELNPHTEVIVPGTAPTCTSTGLTDAKKCSVCGTTTLDHQVIDATGHSYTSTVTNPTCTVKGYTTHTCSVCSDTYKDSYTNALGHTDITVPGTDPTCTETGLTDAKRCSVCNTVTVDHTIINATGHSETTISGKAPTCTATGLSDGKKCTVCNVVTVPQTTVNALGHSRDNWEAAVPATCIDTGIMGHYTCSRCNVYLNANGNVVSNLTLSKIPHSVGQLTPGKAPTCTENGSESYYTCDHCSQKLATDKTTVLKTTVIAKLGHTFTSYEKVDPTCTTAGSYAYRHCSVCNKNFNVSNEVEMSNTVIPANGHDYVYYDYKAPTCEEKGNEAYRECSNCDYSTRVSIPALGHDYQWPEDTDSTEIVHKICSVCNAESDEFEIRVAQLHKNIAIFSVIALVCLLIVIFSIKRLRAPATTTPWYKRRNY